MMRPRNRRGYTLVELVVTVLIIGILAAFGIPQYLQTVETSSADDAVAIVNMIGTTNKMFALDHAGSYVNGAFPAVGACGANACDPTLLANACTLVNCKYLADQDWGSKKYAFNACNGGACAALGNGISAGARLANAHAPYNTWGYYMDATGKINAVGNNPPPPTY